MSIRNELVGQTLKTSNAFKFFRSYSELPLSKINPSYKSNREHIDWVILDIKVAIEVDGEHHFQPVTYGGISKEEAQNKYVTQLRRDGYKDQFCEEVGWILVRVPYYVKIDSEEEMEQFLLQEIKRKREYGGENKT